MEDKIFYSWQSDCPNKTNRGFIQDALKKSVKALKKNKSISVEPVIDRDTAGVAGSPNIVESIFSKIDNASVFVCDVSITYKNTSIENKFSPNPNVLVELGYAIRTLGWSRIIMIVNTDLSDPKNLPFNIDHNRVLQYSTKPNPKDKPTPKQDLSSTLTNALELIFNTEGSITSNAEEVAKTQTMQLESINRSWYDVRKNVIATVPDTKQLIKYPHVFKFIFGIFTKKDKNGNSYRNVYSPLKIQEDCDENFRSFYKELSDNYDVIMLENYILAFFSLLQHLHTQITNADSHTKELAETYMKELRNNLSIYEAAIIFYEPLKSDYYSFESQRKELLDKYNIFHILANKNNIIPLEHTNHYGEAFDIP